MIRNKFNVFQKHTKIFVKVDKIYFLLIQEQKLVTIFVEIKSSSKNPVNHQHLKVLQEMPRMQDFAPFTPEPLGALSSPQTTRRRRHLATRDLGLSHIL